MNDTATSLAIGIVIGIVMGLLIGGLIAAASLSDNSRIWRDDAVNHGFAEYYLDAKHDRQWRWKEAK